MKLRGERKKKLKTSLPSKSPTTRNNLVTKASALCIPFHSQQQSPSTQQKKITNPTKNKKIKILYAQLTNQDTPRVIIF